MRSPFDIIGACLTIARCGGRGALFPVPCARRSLGPSLSKGIFKAGRIERQKDEEQIPGLAGSVSGDGIICG